MRMALVLGVVFGILVARRVAMHKPVFLHYHGGVMDGAVEQVRAVIWTARIPSDALPGVAYVYRAALADDMQESPERIDCHLHYVRPIDWRKKERRPQAGAKQ